MGLRNLKTNPMATNNNPKHSEGPVASMIESQTAKLPSDLFLWAALGSMAVSATLKILGKSHTALFIGQWAPSFLLLGLYNKLVKLEGHDGEDDASGDE
jgi:hypothetical protein